MTDIINTNDTNYLFSGMSFSNEEDFKGMNKGSYDIFLLKIDIEGNIIWKKMYGGSDFDYCNSITTSDDGGFLLTGGTESLDHDFNKINSKGSLNVFCMKLDSNGNLNNTTSINEFSEPTTTLSVHPNPFSNTTTVSYKVETPSNISIELLNTLGQTIEVLRNDYSDSGTYQLPLNVSNLTSGMYSVRMKSGSNSMVVPVWVVR
jgi:hypothetical protein